MDRVRASAAERPIHPEAEPLEPLLGTWRGEGRGRYPTADPFRYGEEIRFTSTGEPYLVYAERSWTLEDESPLHLGSGFWRPRPGGGLEVVLVHVTGHLEISLGTIGEGRIELASTSISRTATADEVTRLERSIELDGDRLRYELRMAAVGQPLQTHLEAELVRAR